MTTDHDNEKRFAVWTQGRYLYVNHDGGYWITISGSGKITTSDLYQLFMSEQSQIVDSCAEQIYNDRERDSKNWASGNGFI